jgi:tetratricopeptide (TPR) repeat protein
MPSKLTCLRVFIASPGGLAEERKAFRDEIQEYNEAEAIHRGFLFQPLGWEDTLGGMGRPQTIIDEDIRKADYFVLVLWNRWGSPPDTSSSRFTSGTEEEYHIALDCYEKKQIRELVMMFKSVDPAQLGDPGPQLQKVLAFRSDIEQQKTHLFHGFDTTESFRKLLRKHLAAWLRTQEDGDAAQELVHPMIAPEIVEIPPEAAQQQLSESPEGALIAKAWALADDGRLTQAEVEFAKAIVGRQRPQSLLEYGRFLSRLGRLEQARLMFERAASVAIDQKDHGAVAIAYGNLGILLRIRGDLDGAEQMHRKALKINEKLRRLENVACDYINLGTVLGTRSDLEGAEQMFSKALEIDEKLGHLEGMARDYGNLGIVFKNWGDLDRAEQMLRKALKINEKLGHLESMACNYGNLGNLLKIRGDLDGAEQMHRESLKIEEKLGHLEGMAIDYENLGSVLETRGDLDGAEQMYKKSLEVAKRLGSPSRITLARSLLRSLRKPS